LNALLRSSIERALSSKFGGGVSIHQTASVGGGCINDTFAIETTHGPFFVKSRSKAPEHFFEREREGLQRIAATHTIRVPQPILNSAEIEASDASDFLILEHIESAAPASDYSEMLGRSLAAMHRATSETFGLNTGNYIGLTPQSNSPKPSWAEFFATQRLEFQLNLLEEKSRATAELRTLLAKLISRLDKLVGGHAPVPSMLHGDLWSGNIMSDESGAPVIVDPAIYYGDREADLAMTELFGALDSRFYDSYAEAWPLSEGYEDRKEIYNLYHLMNHVNLFGLSYLSGVLGILRRFA